MSNLTMASFFLQVFALLIGQILVIYIVVALRRRIDWSASSTLRGFRYRRPEANFVLMTSIAGALLSCYMTLLILPSWLPKDCDVLGSLNGFLYFMVSAYIQVRDKERVLYKNKSKEQVIQEQKEQLQRELEEMRKLMEQELGDACCTPNDPNVVRKRTDPSPSV